MMGIMLVSQIDGPFVHTPLCELKLIAKILIHQIILQIVKEFIPLVQMVEMLENTMYMIQN